MASYCCSVDSMRTYWATKNHAILVRPVPVAARPAPSSIPGPPRAELAPAPYNGGGQAAVDGLALALALDLVQEPANDPLAHDRVADDAVPARRRAVAHQRMGRVSDRGCERGAAACTDRNRFRLRS